MNETAKASIRRSQDSAFVSRFFVGHGIDIGAGDDSLVQQLTRFPKIRSVRSWDMGDGDAQLLSGVQDEQFDFVYSSHCLEHLNNPIEGLKNWLRVLKPGGYLVVSIPDEDLYEHGLWPSVHNLDHHWSFTIAKNPSTLPQSIQIIDLVSHFTYAIECERLSLLKDYFDPDGGLADQTLGKAECAIEFVWRKKSLSYEELSQLGFQLEQQDRVDEAIACYKKAIDSDPYRFEVINGLSTLLARKVSIGEGLQIWDDYLSHRPEAYESQYFRALYLISIGRFDEGFTIRDPLVPDQRRSPLSPPVNYPRWKGQDLSGKSIVIWTEFGLGDEIMFARFATILKSLGAAFVTLVCQKPLVKLFQGLIDVDMAVSVEEVEGLKTHDYWVYPHSIPVYYSLEKYGVPQLSPYIKLDPALAKRASKMLPKKRPLRLRIGLVCRGNPTHENDQLRSIFNLRSIAELLKISGIDWIILQKDQYDQLESEFKELPFYESLSIHFVGSSLQDFVDTAGVCMQLDLLISVDTSVAHLAGALGIDAYLLLPAITDWRWGINQPHSDWYPNMELFRQNIIGNWDAPVKEISQKLTQKLLTLHQGK